jgi:hypothetical protein
MKRIELLAIPQWRYDAAPLASIVITSPSLAWSALRRARRCSTLGHAEAPRRARRSLYQMSPAGFGKLMKTETDTWMAVIKAAGNKED